MVSEKTTNVKNLEKGTKIVVVDIELAENVKEYILKSSDLKISNSLRSKIGHYENNPLLKITKEISSPVEITAVQEITEEFFIKNICKKVQN